MKIHHCFLMIAIPLASFGQPAPQQEVKKGSIDGVVLVETTREPVRRVQVMAYPRRTSAGPATTMGQPQSFTATTDAEGKFTIGNLEPGDYFLNIQKQGFTVARRSTFASSMQIKVGEGETVKGLRYALLPQAVIAGKVLDDEGEPVQGAHVQALAQQAMRGRKSWLPTAQGVQTNDRGEFRLANLLPGKVILQVSAAYQSMMTQEQARPGQPAMGFADTFYPGVTEPARAMQVELTAGAELTGYDVQLKKVPVHRVRGKVLAADGSPAKEFYVSLSSREEPGGGMGVMGVSRAPRSFTRKEDGTFEVGGVPQGAYLAVVNVMNRANPTERQVATAPVDVSDRDVEDLTLQLSLPITLTGSVVLDGALPTGEKPAPGNVSIQLAPADTGMLMFAGGAMPGRPKDDGTFSLQISAPGKYRFFVNGGMGQATYLASIRAGGEEYIAKEIDLSGAAPGAVKIVYRTDGGKVFGTVERGEDQTGGPVMAVVLSKDPALRTGPAGRQIAQVNQNGAFEMSNLRPGEYLALALASADIQQLEDEETMKAFESKFQVVKVTASGSVAVQLKVLAVPADGK
ncbi:MAG TPA: carboxypeptidase-like regulatory domain-containing protein [Paludibaculum sp.]|jgi:hypothetical protein